MKDTSLSPELQAYLQSWFNTSIERKVRDGIDVQLSYPEFLNLFQRRQIRSLEKAILTNRLRYQQDRENEFAFLLTWKSYAAKSTGIFSAATATVCSRQKSRMINMPQPGDQLRASHKAKISRGLTGKPKTQDHRDNLSASLTGRKDSEQIRANKSEAASRRWAAYRAAKAGGE